MLVCKEWLSVFPFEVSANDAEWIAKARALKPVFAARAREVDERGGWPESNFQDLREQGFLRVAVPQEFGGLAGKDAGYSFVCHAIIEIVASACASTAWALLNQWGCIGLIAKLGNEEQKRRILTDVAVNGAMVASAGSEVAPARALASADSNGKLSFAAEVTSAPGGVYLSAFKGFTTGSAASKYVLFWALAPGTEDPDHGVSIFVVERPNDCVEFVPGWEDAIGIRATESGGARFTNVFVPWKNVLGEPGDFNQTFPFSFEVAYAAHLVGISQGIFDIVKETMASRPFLQDDDTNMYTLGEMAAAIHSARTAWWYAQRVFDEEQFDLGCHVTLLALHQAKLAANMVSNKAFDIIGTRAVFRWSPVQRFWRDARVISLHTRETTIMKVVADGEIKQEFFFKAKYGKRLPPGSRKTWRELGFSPVWDAAE
jgi:alkylation response protein AidB-like acyl-CoA dehydrogenase